MEIKKFFWNYCRVQVGNGLKTSFGEEHWIASFCLAKTFPRLFIVSMNRNVTVQEVFDNGWKDSVLGERWLETSKNNGVN
jgi:hypothetical protein